MTEFHEALKTRIETVLKNSQLWPLTRNHRFFQDLIRYPDSLVGIAEGDSWFDYDFISKFIHLSGEDLIGHLCRDGSINVLRLSFAGDTLEDMAKEPQLTNVTDVMNLMIRLDRMLGISRLRPKFVLLSGGGNDMSGNKGKRLRHFLSAAGLIEEKAFHAIDSDFRACFETLIANVRSVDRTVPIFLHGYAYPVPDGRGVQHPKLPANFNFEGPWLKPAFEEFGIPETERCRIMIRMIDRFNEMLENLVRTIASNDSHVHYIDLRGCFERPPYATYKTDWANELHPTSDGFETIAHKFRKAILANLGE